jgi:O-antigen ligase
VAWTLDSPTVALQAAILGLAVMLGLLAGLDPKLAAAAAFGLAFMVLVLANLTAGLCIFAVISFLDLLPFGGAAVTFAKAAGLLLAISWLATLATSRDAENDFVLAHPIFSYLLFAFLAWAALSLLWAEEPGESVTAVYRYALNMMLFLIVFTAVRESKHAVWVVGAFLVGAMVSAAYGLAAPAPQVGPEDIARLGGAGADPNELAASLVAALALAAAFVAGLRRNPAVRILAAGAIVVCTAGVLLSFSRTGLVSMTVALLAAVIIGGRWRPAALLLLVTIATGIGVFLGYYATPKERERVTKADGGTGREDVWAVGVRMIKANPIDGVGAGNFPVSSVHYLLEPGAIQRAEFIVDTPKVAHNLYIGLWAELGAIGFALFTSIVAFVLRCFFGAAQAFKRIGDRPMELLARALFVSVLAMLAAGFFLSEEFSKQLWLLFALGPSLFAVARSAESAASDGQVAA